jgi:hypothetical protein
MDPLFESYFRERLDQYWRSEPSFTARSIPSIGSRGSVDEQAHFMVRSAVERARPVAQASGRGLRSDAELLLYLAFFELVARPVTTVRGQDYSLPNSIAADVENITRQAMNSTAPPKPVSAHDVVNATASLWPQLQSSNWNLWDG